MRGYVQTQAVKRLTKPRETNVLYTMHETNTCIQCIAILCAIKITKQVHHELKI